MLNLLKVVKGFTYFGHFLKIIHLWSFVLINTNLVINI